MKCTVLKMCLHFQEDGIPGSLLRHLATVPIPINFRESEIGAVQVTIYQKKIKTWTVTMPVSSYGYVFRLFVFPLPSPLPIRAS